MILPYKGVHLCNICVEPIIETYKPSCCSKTYQEVRFLIGYGHRWRHGVCVLSRSSWAEQNNTSKVFIPPHRFRFYKVVRHTREAVLIGSIHTQNRKTHTNGKSVGQNKAVFRTKWFLLLCMFVYESLVHVPRSLLRFAKISLWL